MSIGARSDPSLPSINGRIEEAYLTAGEDGPRVSSFSTQGAGDWLVLNIEYSYSLSGGPYEIPIEIVEYYEDGFALSPRERCVDRGARVHRRNDAASGWAGPRPGEWAPGHYAVFVYAGGRRVAEVYYEVTP